MSPKVKASANEWTLRFKIKKMTVLLSCKPDQSFETIRVEILNSLKATGVKVIEGEELPEDPQDVILGVPMDKNHLEKGWVNLEIPEFDEGDAKRKGGVKKGSVFNQTPLGAGLKDGDMLAMRFKKQAEDEMELDGDWDVVLPSMDDDVGEQE